MAQNNRNTGYPVQKPVMNLGQPQGGHAPYPMQNIVGGGYPTQHYHQPPYAQQYPQPYPQTHPQPNYGQSFSPYGQPNYGTAPPPYPGMVPNPNIPQPMVQGSFDSGARFGSGSSPNIPPPPPGVMPTSVQMAAARGQAVAMQQPKAGWLEGASGGGYTFW